MKVESSLVLPLDDLPLGLSQYCMIYLSSLALINLEFIPVCPYAKYLVYLKVRLIRLPVSLALTCRLTLSSHSHELALLHLFLLPVIG